MAADVALNRDLTAAYPFCRLDRTRECADHAGVPFRPISTKMLQELARDRDRTAARRLDMPVQIVHLTATDSDLVNMAALAAYNISG